MPKNHDIHLKKGEKERYIEVKATKSGPNTTFYMSSNELNLMFSEKNKYQIYRVYNVNQPNLTLGCDVSKYPVEKGELVHEPIDFNVAPKK